MSYMEKLKELTESFGDKTVKELLTSDSVALAQAVGANVLLNLNNFRDYRELCAITKVPRGAGKTVNVQLMTATTYSDWTEGTALSAADPTVSSVAVTIGSFGKVTPVSDLLANTSGINFVDVIGRAHAASVKMGIVDKTVDQMESATSINTVHLGTKADSTEATVYLSNIKSAIGANLNSGFVPDFLATSPEKLWNALTSTTWDGTNAAGTQFTGGMADFLVKGKAPIVMGLETYADPFYETAVGAFAGTDGEEYAIVGTKGMSCAWAQLQDEPESIIERVPGALASYITTHLDGGANEGHVKSICLIDHAA